MAPEISVIIPCRNEVTYIGRCVRSLLANDYPRGHVEILVVDGMSTDGSRDVVKALTREDPRVRLVDNLEGTTPVGMNRGVRAASGDFIFMMGAHNEYDPAFLSRAIGHHERFAADNVGGIIVTRPRSDRPFGRAVAAATSHPFGVGGSRFRTRPAQPVWTDTVFGGCYRRSVFERIGLFNEFLVRGQDMEFNLRLAAAGGRTLLAPDLSSVYHARSRFGEYVRYNWLNGVWAILPFQLSPIRPVSWRHLAPLVFALTLTALAVVGLFDRTAWWALGALLGLWGLAALAAAVHVAWRERDARIGPYALIAFAGIHFPYGFGSLWAALRMLGWRLRGRRRPTPEQAWPRLVPE